MISATPAVLITRGALFFSCRKYLLRSLYSDLEDLSSDGQSLEFEDDIQLETLPPPSAQSSKTTSRFARERTSLHSSIARSIFSACFSESCILFFLLVFQALDLFDPRSRLWNWRLSIYLLLTIILVLIPLFTTLILTIGVSSKSDQVSRKRLLPRVFLSILSAMLYLFAVTYIPLPASLASSDILMTALSRLIVLGTIILGLLSGFGAVSSSWAFIPRNRPAPTDADLASAESAVSRIREDLQRRRHEAQGRVKSPVNASWFSGIVPNFRSDEHAQEIQGLEALEYQMTVHLEELKQRREAARFSSTAKGRLYGIGGRVFALYCVFRILNSIVNVLFPRSDSPTSTNYSDLITELLAYLLSLMSADVKSEDVALIARQISLVLVGVIILTSMRLVLRGVTRALRITNRNLGASLMLLVLSQLMGIYLLSTIVQLRTSFPPPPIPPESVDEEDNIKNLFSTIPQFEVFGSLFNWSLLIAAGASGFARWAADKVNGPKEN